MLIWNGRGYVVALLAFGCALLAEFSTETYFNDSEYYQTHRWPMALAFVLAGFAVGLVAKQFKAEARKRLVDLGTNRELIDKDAVAQPNDSLFFIPVGLWPPVFLVLAIVVMLTEK